MADTATATGYNRSLVTLRVSPSVAMMKENSPICERLMPARTAVFKGWPASTAPLMLLSGCPIRVTTHSTSTGSQCSRSTCGSIIMPTETKKIDAKRSLTGFTRCSIRSALVVSASNEPMTKAPRGALNPAATATYTMLRHRATDTISSVSSFIHLFVRFKKEGIKKMPTTNHRTRKKPSLPISKSKAPPENSRLTATVLSSTSSRMATRSSTTSTPSTTLAKEAVFKPSSSKARMMMVVELIERIPPRKRLSIMAQPRARPVRNPAPIIKDTVTMVVTTAVPPTFINLRKLNSRPRLNSRKITPISLQVTRFFSSMTDGTRFTCGPTSRPATM